MPIISGTLVCLVLLVAPLFIATPIVNAAGPAFAPAFNLSHDNAVAKQPAVSNNGQNVYVAWTEGNGGIKFRMSTNGGSTWTPPTSSSPLRISPTGAGKAAFPVMFTQYAQVNAGDVYVAWSQGGSIYVAASTNNGLSFATTKLGSGITPAIGAWGSDVYVAWYQTSTCPHMSGGCINAAASSSNGASGSWTSYELNPSTNGEPQVVGYGSNAYIIADGTYYSELTNNGATLNINSTQVYGFGMNSANGQVTFGREPWIAASGSNVYVTFNALDLSTSAIRYRIYGLSSSDGGSTWNPAPSSSPTTTTQASMLLSGSITNDWEPENAAFGSTDFLTFHALSNQGIYMVKTTGAGSSASSTAPVLVSATGRQSAYAHVFTSDGVNVFVMWGQKVSSSSSTWNAYISYSSNGGSTWSSPQTDISNNANGVAAGNLDVTLFALSSNGAHAFCAWTYTSGTTSQIYFSSS